MNFNCKNYLKKCLDSLSSQSCQDYELFIVDNASTDGSLEYLKTLDPNITIIANRKNLGYAKANNEAVKYVGGEYLFFLNCDTWLDKNCLKNLLRRVEKNEGIFTPKQMSYDGRSFISCGLGCDIFGYPCSIHRDKKLFYADGAALFIKKDLFVELGMFDERTFFSFEDIDLSWIALLQGYNVIPVQDAIVYHASGGTLKGGLIKGSKYITNIWRRYLGERNNLRNILKNYHLFTLFWILPLYLSINLAEMLLFSFIGKFKVVKNCYLKAWWYNILNFPDTWKQHREIQKKRKIGDWEIFKRMEWKIAKFQVLRKVGIPKFK